MNILKNTFIAVLVLIFSIIVFLSTLYNYGLSKVSNDDTLKEIVIEQGSINSIAITLYNNHLIKSKLAFNIYTRISGNTNLQAATYELSENMGTKEIVKILGSGSNTADYDTLTFNEGINMRTVASTIAKYTNNSEEDVYNLLEDDDFLENIIDKYWFLTDDIRNEDIYYSLEGYLYPNTYAIDSVNTSVEDIFISMLDEMDNQLEPYKEIINDNSLTIHQILTLASIVELEGVELEDRKKIAGVFFNRLDAGMNLGSDVTTYYAAKIDVGERDLLSSEISDCNNYNTRCSTFKTLPISPICNPSIDSIESVLEPDDNDYYYFVADINKKVYFSKTSSEHNTLISELQKSGLWYEY